MRIVVSRQNLAQDVFLFLLVLLLGAGSAYCWVGLHLQEAAYGLAIAAVVVALLSFAKPQITPLLVIDETGVFDQRLGVGKIPWSDIEGVQIEVAYGNRFLCFRVRDPDRYVEKLSGPKREKVLFHRELGFGTFNVDVGSLNLSLLDLKKEIERRISK